MPLCGRCYVFDAAVPQRGRDRAGDVCRDVRRIPSPARTAWMAGALRALLALARTGGAIDDGDTRSYVIAADVA
jgi:hypothetical protein